MEINSITTDRLLTSHAALSIRKRQRNDFLDEVTSADKSELAGAALGNLKSTSIRSVLKFISDILMKILFLRSAFTHTAGEARKLFFSRTLRAGERRSDDIKKI
jgi:hypothetical protein